MSFLALLSQCRAGETFASVVAALPDRWRRSVIPSDRSRVEAYARFRVFKTVADVPQVGTELRALLGIRRLADRVLCAGLRVVDASVMPDVRLSPS